MTLIICTGCKDPLNTEAHGRRFHVVVKDNLEQLNILKFKVIGGVKCVKRKPHWPAWANYKATDEDGEVWFYQDKPEVIGYKWDISPSPAPVLDIHKVRKNYTGKWKKSLRRIVGD